MSKEHITVTTVLPSGVERRVEHHDVVSMRIIEGCLQVRAERRVTTYAPDVWRAADARLVEED